ncbi:MAG TPA: outer membrane protein transport protein [Deltaproteobacteria bacterium]|nr:outer membrane protein transport protein [Deltaproteobacteria bacterium]
MIRARTYIFIFLPIVTLVLSTPPLHAALYEQLVTSPLASSMGSAVTAYPPGALAIHYNPAGLANIPGTRFDNSIGFVSTYREVTLHQAIDPETGKPWAPFGGWFNNGVDPLDGSKDKQESGYMIIPYIDYAIPYLITPGMAVSYKPPEPKYSRWTFGIGQYAPFGAGLKNAGGSNDSMSYLGQKAFFIRMSFITPAIAYKLSDTISVGASVGIGPSLFYLESKLRTPNTMVALTGALGESTEGLEIPVISELTLPPPWFNGGMTSYATQGHLEVFVEDYFTTSYNLGILWEPYEWFALGACYQSESEANMEGDFKFTYGNEFRRTVDWLGRSPLTIITAAIFDLPFQSVANQKGTATFNLTWPQRLQLGVKLRPIKQVTLTCDANWTDWEVQSNWTFIYDQKIQLFRFARMLGYQYSPDSQVFVHNFKNTWHLSYGCEIKPIDKIALRFGFDKRPTSTRTSYFGPLPFPDLTIYSLGIGIDVDDKPKPRPKDFHELTQQINHANHIDITVSYIKLKDTTIKNNTSVNLNSTTFTDIVYNPYAGLDWHQEMHLWWFAVNQVFRW